MENSSVFTYLPARGSKFRLWLSTHVSLGHSIQVEYSPLYLVVCICNLSANPTKLEW